MKILNLKNVMSVLTCLALTLAVAAPSVTYAGDKGKHKGWCKDYKGDVKGKGKHKGWTVFHEKQCPSNPSGGETWTVRILDLYTGSDPMDLTVNSLTTVQEVINTAVGGGEAPGNAYLRDCLPFNCATDGSDTNGPLDPSLSLEKTTVTDGETLYLTNF